MKKYYVIDGNETVLFESVNQLVKHMEQLVQRKYKKSRPQFLQHYIDLGHGYDDNEGRMFLDVLSEQFNIGIVKKDGTLAKCRVHDVERYSKYRVEMGD